MSNFEPPYTESPFDDLESVLASVGHSLITKGKTQVATIFAKASISLEYTAHDNWNGGTSVWALCIEIPYPDYSAYTEEERNELESFIDGVIKPFLPDMGHWVNSKFKPVSINDPDWRTNINNQSEHAVVSNNQVTDFEKVNKIFSFLTNHATGNDASNYDYIELRHELLSNKKTSVLLPPWLKTHRNLDSFLGFIQPKYSTYAERRAFLAEEFSPVLNALEFGYEVEIQAQENIHPSNTKEKLKNVNNKKKVFIVHGRDNEAKQEVSRYIESLGLEAIILHEQVSSGMTIIEKIEHYSNEADFALILYTACDHGRGVHEKKVPPKNRARQNVVFEHGYLMAKLGRKNVCALVKGDIETPNDISGVVYVSHDMPGAWKIEINKELQQCGYQTK